MLLAICSTGMPKGSTHVGYSCKDLLIGGPGVFHGMLEYDNPVVIMYNILIIIYVYIVYQTHLWYTSYNARISLGTCMYGHLDPVTSSTSRSVYHFIRIFLAQCSVASVPAFRTNVLILVLDRI